MVFRYLRLVPKVRYKPKVIISGYPGTHFKELLRLIPKLRFKPK